MPNGPRHRWNRKDPNAECYICGLIRRRQYGRTWYVHTRSGYNSLAGPCRPVSALEVKVIAYINRELKNA